MVDKERFIVATKRVLALQKEQSEAMIRISNIGVPRPMEGYYLTAVTSAINQTHAIAEMIEAAGIELGDLVAQTGELAEQSQELLRG